MNITVLLFYICIDFCFGASLLQSNIYENEGNCKTFNNTAGECIPIENCPSLFTLSNEIPFPPTNHYILILSNCGNGNVCCDVEDGNIEFGVVTPNTASLRFLGATGPNKLKCSESQRCILTKDCPNLLKYLKTDEYTELKRDYFRKVGCGFDGKDPMVCCSDEPVELIPDSILTEEITSDLLPDLSVCGPMSSDKIVGGKVAVVGEFPWMALLQYTTKNGNQFNCGGSLINSRYVLTAAHCIKDSLISVRLGEYDIGTSKDCDYCDEAIDIAIEQVIKHEGYVDKTNDIGLIRLAKEVNYTDFIKPICLPTTPDLFRKAYVGTIMTVAGWGITENGTSSDILLKLNVPIRPVTECSSLYGAKIQIASVILCAGGEKGKDSCQGDSGGPLMVAEQANIYATGVVSFGSGKCGLQHWPAVYTKVSRYMKWVVSKLKL